MLEQKPILTITCHEPEGDIDRSVRQLILTPDNLYKFWEKAKAHKTLFQQEIREDFNKFCSVFLRYLKDGTIESTGLMWVIDDFVGVFYITDIIYPDDANVHYSFLDGRHRGRYELGKAMLDYVFTTYNFNRLSCEIPIHANFSNKFVHTFVGRIGFRKEGRRSKSFTYSGKLLDSYIYGIVNPSLLKGE